MIKKLFGNGIGNIVFVVMAGIIIAGIICVIVISAGSSDEGTAASAATQPEEPIVRYVTKTETETVYVDNFIEVQVEKEITTDILEEGLRDMGKLVTQEYWFNEVTTFESTKTYVGFIHANSKLVMGYEGRLLAGIDFTAVGVEKDDAAKVITVYLPNAEIIACDLDLDSFEVYEEDVSRSNPITAADYNGSLIELEERAQQRALDRGILDSAAENAKKLIEGFIGGLVDLNVYKVEFVIG